MSVPSCISTSPGRQWAGFRPVSGDRFVTSWYVLFSDEAFLGTYYVRAGDESQAGDLAEALGAIAEVTVRQSPTGDLYC